MPKTSEFDQPIAFDANGEPDLWDHDTLEGQARIQKRIAEARGAEIALSSGSLIARVDAAIAERFRKDSKRRNAQLEGLTEGIVQAFKAEREKQINWMREALVTFKEEVSEMREQRDRLTREIETLKRDVPPRLLKGGKDAA